MSCFFHELLSAVFLLSMEASTFTSGCVLSLHVENCLSFLDFFFTFKICAMQTDIVFDSVNFYSSANKTTVTSSAPWAFLLYCGVSLSCSLTGHESGVLNPHPSTPL